MQMVAHPLAWIYQSLGVQQIPKAGQAALPRLHTDPGGEMISETGLRLAMLDTVREEDTRTMRRNIERLREKQAELTRIQREAKALAQSILVTQRQIAAITDEMSNLVARGER
jgi:hypothetical protein